MGIMVANQWEYGWVIKPAHGIKIGKPTGIITESQQATKEKKGNNAIIGNEGISLDLPKEINVATKLYQWG